MKAILLCAFSVCCLSVTSLEATPPRPNVVIILADDLGYGDVQCNNPERGKIPTPNIDRLAAQGMRFTDGHSSSGVCSPSRYTLLTGRYHWRTRLQRGIVGLWEKPLIAADRLTIAGLLKQQGYATAAVGKWHLGWDWPAPEGDAKKGSRDWTQTIRNGPATRGFDSYFGTDVPNWPPYCFIENDHTVGIPSVPLPAALLEKKSHLASLPGPALPDWRLEAILPSLADRACRIIAERAAAPEPFFLYMPLTAPHTPLAVADVWKGKSGLGTYADFVMQTDATVGRVLDALEQSGAASNTLVFFSSDNGCAPYIGVQDMEAKGHFPSGSLRGYKADAWEGGHRVPFLARWPGVVEPGSRCDQLVLQADFMATVAEILDAKLPETAGEDSISFLSLLKGGTAPVRKSAINQSAGGLFAVREGPWKYIAGPGSGGWSKGGTETSAQLYNLSEDLAEKTNLVAQQPERVAQMKALLAKLVTDGRSTPGASRKNDVPVQWDRTESVTRK